MAKTIGEEYMALGVLIGDELTAKIHFSWNYKEGCVTLGLNTYKLHLKPKIVRDYGLVIFNNCDLLSYITVPKQ